MATVLVLDDIDVNRKLLRKLLEREGYRVLEAANGAEGLGVAKVEHPDVVISDLLMPKMDGYEFLRALRDDPQTASMQVIFYTAAYNEAEVRALADDSDVRSVLQKPADQHVILEAVADAVAAQPRSARVVVDDEAFQREHLRIVNEKLLDKVGELDRINQERQRLLNHLVVAESEERKRIAADIHDDSIQVMAAAGMRLQMLRRKLSDPEHLVLLDQVEETVAASIKRLRALMFQLRPPALEREGLRAALLGLLDDRFRDTDTAFSVHSDLESEPRYDTRAAAYQIASEALINARKHAEASNVRVSLGRTDEGLLVTVADDGAGFVADDHEPAPGHLGMVNMRERAAVLGGTCRVSSAPGEGTVVEIWIPWASGDEAESSDVRNGDDEAIGA